MSASISYKEKSTSCWYILYYHSPIFPAKLEGCLLAPNCSVRLLAPSTFRILSKSVTVFYALWLRNVERRRKGRLQHVGANNCSMLSYWGANDFAGKQVFEKVMLEWMGVELMLIVYIMHLFYAWSCIITLLASAIWVEVRKWKLFKWGIWHSIVSKEMGCITYPWSQWFF